MRPAPPRQEEIESGECENENISHVFEGIKISKVNGDKLVAVSNWSAIFLDKKFSMH